MEPFLQLATWVYLWSQFGGPQRQDLSHGIQGEGQKHARLLGRTEVIS